MSEAQKKSMFWIGFTIIISTMAMMADYAVYPAAHTLYTIYADANIALLNFNITGASLTVIPGSILCGILAQYIGKKRLLAGAYLVFLVSMLPIVIENLWLGAIVRSIVGLCMGFVSVCTAGLIAELFEDEKSHSKMMGLWAAGLSFMGIYLSLAAGFLALIHWTYVFAAYIITVPILMCIFMFIPKTQPEGVSEKKGDASEKMPWGRITGIVIATLVLNCLYSSASVSISVLLAEENLGDASTSGLMNTLGAIGNLSGAFVFSVIFMRAKRYTPAVISGAMGVIFMVFAFADSAVFVGVCKFFLGAAYVLSMSYYLMYPAMIAPPSKASLAIALANSGIYLGYFLGAYTMPFYQSVFSLDKVIGTLPYMAATCGIFMLFSIIIATYERKLGYRL